MGILRARRLCKRGCRCDAIREGVVGDSYVAESEGALQVVLERAQLHIARAHAVAREHCVARLPTHAKSAVVQMAVFDDGAGSAPAVKVGDDAHGGGAVAPRRKVSFKLHTPHARCTSKLATVRASVEPARQLVSCVQQLLAAFDCLNVVLPRGPTRAVHLGASQHRQVTAEKKADRVALPCIRERLCVAVREVVHHRFSKIEPRVDHDQMPSVDPLENDLRA
eukprot:7391792-Prymnesium_polylepis.1